VSDIFGKIANGIAEAAGAVGNAVSDAASAVGGAVSDAANTVATGVSDAASAVGGAVSDTANTVETGVSEAVGAIGNAFSGGGGSAGAIATAFMAGGVGLVGGGLIGEVLSVAREPLNGIIQMINQQLMRILEDVTLPIHQIVQNVTGGIWRGHGADAFVAEMQKDILPNLDNLGEKLGNLSLGCSRALDTIDQVDEAVSGTIASITDAFNFF